MYIISKSINNITSHVYLCISFSRILAVNNINDNHHSYLLGTFRSMDNTCVINLAYSLKSQCDINPIWYPDMDTVLCNPVHTYTCLHCAYFFTVLFVYGLIGRQPLYGYMGTRNQSILFSCSFKLLFILIYMYI